MKVLRVYKKMVIGVLNLMISIFTNDLVVHAKQVNYFEMFLLSVFLESKNILFKNLNVLFETFNFKTVKLNQIVRSDYFIK